MALVPPLRHRRLVATATGCGRPTVRHKRTVAASKMRSGHSIWPLAGHSGHIAGRGRRQPPRWRRKTSGSESHRHIVFPPGGNTILGETRGQAARLRPTIGGDNAGGGYRHQLVDAAPPICPPPIIADAITKLSLPRLCGGDKIGENSANT